MWDKAVIHKDTGELVSDRLGQKRRAHRAVHASAERQEDPALSHLFPDLTDRGVLVVRHALCPIPSSAVKS